MSDDDDFGELPVIIIPEQARVLAHVQAGGDLFLMDHRWRADREIVLAAVTLDGNALGFVAPSLQSDPVVVEAAVCSVPTAFRFANLQFDSTAEDHIVRLLIEDGKARLALRYASNRVRADSELVMMAVSVQGQAIQFAHTELRGNAAIVLAAVNNDGFAYQWASDELKARGDVIEAAIRRTPQARSMVEPNLLIPGFQHLNLNPTPSLTGADDARAEAERTRALQREMEGEEGDTSPARKRAVTGVVDDTELTSQHAIAGSMGGEGGSGDCTHTCTYTHTHTSNLRLLSPPRVPCATVTMEDADAGGPDPSPPAASPCVICLRDSMVDPATANCGHVFCKECITKWCTRDDSEFLPNSCPTCRATVSSITTAAGLEPMATVASSSGALPAGDVQAQEDAYVAELRAFQSFRKSEMAELDRIRQEGGDSRVVDGEVVQPAQSSRSERGEARAERAAAAGAAGVVVAAGAMEVETSAATSSPTVLLDGPFTYRELSKTGKPKAVDKNIEHGLFKSIEANPLNSTRADVQTLTEAVPTFKRHNVKTKRNSSKAVMFERGQVHFGLTCSTVCKRAWKSLLFLSLLIPPPTPPPPTTGERSQPRDRACLPQDERQAAHRGNVRQPFPTRRQEGGLASVPMGAQRAGRALRQPRRPRRRVTPMYGA